MAQLSKNVDAKLPCNHITHSFLVMLQRRIASSAYLCHAWELPSFSVKWLAPKRCMSARPGCRKVEKYLSLLH